MAKEKDFPIIFSETDVRSFFDLRPELESSVDELLDKAETRERYESELVKVYKDWCQEHRLVLIEPEEIGLWEDFKLFYRAQVMKDCLVAFAYKEDYEQSSFKPVVDKLFHILVEATQVFNIKRRVVFEE